MLLQTRTVPVNIAEQNIYVFSILVRLPFFRNYSYRDLVMQDSGLHVGGKIQSTRRSILISFTYDIYVQNQIQSCSRYETGYHTKSTLRSTDTSLISRKLSKIIEKLCAHLHMNSLFVKKNVRCVSFLMIIEYTVQDETKGFHSYH